MLSIETYSVSLCPENSSSGELQNLGGLFGSYLSETLYFIFGQASFLIPLLLIFAAFLIYHKQDTNDNNNLSRYFGFFIFLFSFSLIFSQKNCEKTLEKVFKINNEVKNTGFDINKFKKFEKLCDDSEFNIVLADIYFEHKFYEDAINLYLRKF